MHNESSLPQQPAAKLDNCPEQYPSTEQGGNAPPAVPQPERWANIPQELRDSPHWCVAGTGKEPLTSTYHPASSTNPLTWCDFDTACQAAQAKGLHIGYVPTADDPFTCIDLDVKDDTPDDVKAEHKNIIKYFDSYTERSRSGNGFHIWVHGNIGKGHNRKNVEVYSQEHFIICTGNIYNDKPIQAGGGKLDNLVQHLQSEQHTAEPLPDTPETATDEVILDRARGADNKDKFNKLWAGDQSGHPSQSEADFALMSMLAFYSGNNEQCKRLFRLSALGKRDKAQKDDRYLNTTIGKLRRRQAVEQQRVDAIKEQMSAMEDVTAEQREAQRYKFKQIGNGETDISAARAPTMDLDTMLQSLVFVSAERTLVAFRDQPTISASLAGMGNLLAHNTIKKRNAKGKLVKVSIFNQWKEHKRRIVVYTVTFDPRAREFCNSPDQRLALNLWRPRPHTEPTDWTKRVQPFIEHVRYLIPEEVERGRFLDWIAHIEQRPGELPHAHYLMIATEQGVGRNWLASLFAYVWAGNVALDFDLKQSLRNGFNGQLSRKLLAVVDEINEGGKAERWEHSEKLKSMVTTSERFINVKYGLQQTEVNCCRWLLFSNYESALPLHTGDRRWNVIRNPSTPRNAQYYTWLYKLLNDPVFISSVREFLITRDITQFNPGERAVMNDAKQAVISTSLTAEDERAAELVESHPQELISADHLFYHIYGEMPDRTPESSRRWKLLQPIAAKAGIEKLRELRRPEGRYKIWVLRNPQRWRQSDPQTIARELGLLT